MRRGQPDTHIRPRPCEVIQDQSQSSKHFSTPFIEPSKVSPASCPLPPPPPTFRRCEWQGGGRGRQEAGGRSPPVLTVHTGACVTLLDYYYLSFPLSFDLSLSATLQNINFAFWNFSAGGLYTPTRYLYLYRICMWCNTIGVRLFFVAHFIKTRHFFQATKVLKSPICSRLTIFPRYFLSLHPGYFWSCLTFFVIVKIRSTVSES